MKKILTAGLLAAALGFVAPTINASGIPTVDVATGIILVQNATTQAQQALDALNEAKEGIEQAKSQYENHKNMISGNSGLGDFLDDPELNKVMPLSAWGDMYSDVKGLPELRQRYGLQSDNAEIQKKFDKLLAATGALEENYDASTQRVKNAEKLRTQLNVAQTPQQKEDLQLRYQQEFLELQNQQMRMANMNMLIEQEEKNENIRRSQALNDYLRGKSKVLPSYD
jgi:type IV secretion system protein VirB5